MKKTRARRNMGLDVEHMRRLHQEAIEQLELMRTALEGAEHTIGTMRDTLEEMALDHWNNYQDALHMITMHDEALAAIMSKHGTNMRDGDAPEDSDQQLFGNHTFLFVLLRALIRRHRRFWDIYGWRGNPMSDYLKESMTMEREHIAELIAMIQDII